MGIEIFGAEDIMLDTVGRNKERIAQYIKNQIEEDKIMDPMTLKEYFDPFNVETKAILIAEWGYTRKADQIVRLQPQACNSAFQAQSKPPLEVVVCDFFNKNNKISIF